MWWNGDWGWAMWAVMTVAMIGFWSLVIWLLATVLRGGGAVARPSRDPDDILSERFARGEMDEEEFRRRREVLHTRH